MLHAGTLRSDLAVVYILGYREEDKGVIMAEYIDKDKFMVILANIAKIKAKSEAQKSLMGRCMFCLDKMSAEDVVEIKERKIGKWIEVWERFVPLVMR